MIRYIHILYLKGYMNILNVSILTSYEQYHTIECFLEDMIVFREKNAIIIAPNTDVINVIKNIFWFNSRPYGVKDFITHGDKIVLNDKWIKMITKRNVSQVRGYMRNSSLNFMNLTTTEIDKIEHENTSLPLYEHINILLSTDEQGLEYEPMGHITYSMAETLDHI